MKASLEKKHLRGLGMNNEEVINETAAASSHGQWTCNCQNQTPGDREVPVPRKEWSVAAGVDGEQGNGQQEGVSLPQGTDRPSMTSDQKD